MPLLIAARMRLRSLAQGTLESLTPDRVRASTLTTDLDALRGHTNGLARADLWSVGRTALDRDLRCRVLG